jgi:hypothetical protein
MGARDFFISVVFVLLFGLGVTMATSGHYLAEFWVARAAFLLAALALAAGAFLWFKEQPRPQSYRLTAGIGTALYIVFLTPVLIYWVNMREREARPEQAATLLPPKPPAGNPATDARDPITAQFGSQPTTPHNVKLKAARGVPVVALREPPVSKPDGDKLTRWERADEHVKGAFEGFDIAVKSFGKGSAVQADPNGTATNDSLGSSNKSSLKGFGDSSAANDRKAAEIGSDAVLAPPAPAASKINIQDMIAKISQIRKHREDGDVIFDRLFDANTDELIQAAVNSAIVWDRSGADIVGDAAGSKARGAYLSAVTVADSYWMIKPDKTKDASIYFKRRNYLNIIRFRQQALSAVADMLSDSIKAKAEIPAAIKR